MKQIIYFGLCISLLITACHHNEQKEEKELSSAERYTLDSLSKVKQRMHNDSLKKTNPLLILPPDSTYTGTYTDKYPDGITKFRGFFRFGKRHGQWMSFYPNGLMWSEMHYDKGLRDGPNRTYFIDGKPRYIGLYKKDLKDSVWNFYDSLGVLIKKAVYKNGRLVKELSVN